MQLTQDECESGFEQLSPEFYSCTCTSVVLLQVDLGWPLFFLPSGVTESLDITKITTEALLGGLYVPCLNFQLACIAILKVLHAAVRISLTTFLLVLSLS